MVAKAGDIRARRARRASDQLRWQVDGEAFGWKLPPAAPSWARWPVIRAFRAMAAAWRIERHYSHWRGSARSGYDAWVVYAIGRGWC
jgi:hypothetical protein